MMQFIQMAVRPHTHTHSQTCSVFVWRALKHIPWPAQLPDLKITEQLCSVLDSSMRSRSPSPSFLKKLEGILQEVYKLYYRQMVAQICINKERSTFHKCFHYFVHPLSFLLHCTQYWLVHTLHTYRIYVNLACTLSEVSCAPKTGCALESTAH